MAIDRKGRDSGPTATTLVPGLHVVTRDGQELGTLKEIAGSFFKVDAPMQRDYWLSSAEIASRQAEEVVLGFEQAKLDEHKLAQPGMEPEDDPMRGVEIAPMISSEELLEQRVRMERELAEQSKHLPSHEVTVTESRERREEAQIPEDHTGFGELAGETVPYAPALDERQGRPTTGGDLLAATSMAADAAPGVHAPSAMKPAAGKGDDVGAPEAARMIESIERDSGASAGFDTMDAGRVDASRMPENPLATSQPGGRNGMEPGTTGTAAPIVAANGATASGAGDPSAHPTPGEVAFPAGAGRTSPYGPVSQQAPAAPIERQALRGYDGDEPKATGLSRVGGIVGHPTIVAGALATAAIAGPMYLARRTGVSKLDFPLLWGSTVRKPDGKARLLGVIPPPIPGVVAFPFAYRAGFKALGVRPSAKAGAMMGLPHAAFAGAAAAVMGKVHPRALEHGDADLLGRVGHVKAPGFAGRRYGWLTPVGFLAGHVVYGAIIGWWMGKSEKSS